MAKSKLLISIFFLSLLFSSCEKENPKELCGTWVIKKMTVDGKEFDKLLYVNTISFSCKDNLAYFHGSIHFDKDEKAKWKLTKNDNNNILNISSTIKIYNDNFDIKIDKEKNGQPHLALKSSKVAISALKIIDE